MLPLFAIAFLVQVAALMFIGFGPGSASEKTAQVTMGVKNATLFIAWTPFIIVLGKTIASAIWRAVKADANQATGPTNQGPSPMVVLGVFLVPAITLHASMALSSWLFGHGRF